MEKHGDEGGKEGIPIPIFRVCWFCSQTINYLKLHNKNPKRL